MIALTDLTQLITSIATLVGVLRITVKVETIHRSTNSLMERLIKTTSDASAASGRAEGLVEGHARGIIEGKKSDIGENK